MLASEQHLSIKRTTCYQRCNFVSSCARGKSHICYTLYSNEKKLFSFYYNFVWRIVYTIYLRVLDNLSVTYELYAFLLDCQFSLGF
jgi:hypothetical protein